MMITEEMLSALREAIRPYLTGKRLQHTLAVEDAAAQIGGIFLPEDVNKLRAAALLHDITKKADTEKQLQYCAEFGIMVTENDVRSPKIFHAKTAAALAERDFAAYADPKVLEGIRWHTTGHAGMTMFEAIVYLADYIEATRTFQDCIALREYFLQNMESARTAEEKETVLNRTMVLSFDMTIRNLLEEGAPVDSDTIAARNDYLYRLI
ncbi:MAG: HD domain-containing protein [Ruminococcaceae bacterium]|nr:HD domain-containing protein [Oscillospiraceae bacterium]